MSILLLAAVTFFASCAKTESSKISSNSAFLSSVPAGATWVLDSGKTDEFNTTSLDTSKWSAAPLWYWDGVTGLFAFRPENVTVSGGYAHITAKQETFTTTHDSIKNYTAGCLKSKFELGGDTYLEVRARMLPRLANVCAAIWLGDEPTVAKNPNIEIDMQESKDADGAPDRLTTSALKWPMPYNSAHPNDVYFSENRTQPAGLDLAFHTYGLERRNGQVRFYMDDSLYKTWSMDTVPAFVTQLRPLILSIEGHAGTPSNANLPADFLVDWVRVYHTAE